MKNDHLRELCRSAPSIADELAKDPSRSVDQVVKSMRREWRSRRKASGSKKHAFAGEKDRLDRAVQCGKFPYRPSELFLKVRERLSFTCSTVFIEVQCVANCCYVKVYADVLDCISRKPLSNLVSPSLIGTSGVVPLSIVSIIADIMRHYADVIANAQHEVFIATNYWENSHSSRLVSDALRALSKRGIEEQRSDEDKIVVKVIYDRGTASQLVNNHAPVPPARWESVGLPRPEELKGIRMEVVNYHRPPLGTFHAKYLVVDRKVACINSNNVQDRPNVEMCLHLEGPIVDSFYDVALFSWSNRLEPPPPLLSEPPPRGLYQFGDANKSLQCKRVTFVFLSHLLSSTYCPDIDTEFASVAARSLLKKQLDREAQQDGDRREGDAQRNYSGGNGPVVSQMIRAATGIPGNDSGLHGKDELLGEHLAMSFQKDEDKTGGESLENDDEDVAAQSRDRVTSAEDMKGQTEECELEERQNRARAESDAYEIQFNGSCTFSCTSAGDSSSSGRRSRVEAITKHLNGHRLKTLGTVEDDDSMDDFQPHIMHAPHDPVPIAMVNRPPRGSEYRTPCFSSPRRRRDRD